MKKRNLGFSLIELMVVVAIVGVLATFAFGSYDSYVTRTNRAIGKSFLSQVASKQEQYFADNKQYADDMKALGYAYEKFGVDNRSNVLDPSDSTAIYVMTLTNTDGNRTYTVEAVPTNAQAGKDSECGTLSITQAGTKGVSGSGTSCW
jgi:type IV pilus assembly protein PilE